MTQKEYEHYKQRLDEQLEAGIELLRAAHAQQHRALDLVWTMREGPEPAPAASPSPTPRARREPWKLLNDAEAALGSLPDVFDRNDLVRVLGYQPDRGSLYRTLQELVGDGILAVEFAGSGRSPARYRKAR